MSVIIENSKGMEISPQQALLLNEYVKKYLIDGIIKKEEIFRNQILKEIIYHKNSNENDQQIISELQVNNVYIEIKEHILLPPRKLIKTNVYSSDGTLTFKYNSLRDQNDDLICTENIDLSTGKPIYDETIKRYYDRNLDPVDEVFECVFKEDGTLDYIKYNAHSEQDGICFAEDGTPGEEDIPTLCLYAGLTEQEMHYYLTATLLP